MEEREYTCNCCGQTVHEDDVTCIGCGEVVHEDYVTCDCCGEAVHENYVMHAELTGEALCESCEHSDLEHGSKLYRFSPDDGVQMMLFGDYNALHGSGDRIDDSGMPKWAWSFWPENWKGRKDALNLHKLDDGWATGGWSDVPHKWSFNEFVQALVSQEIVPPAPLYILFEPTSNVFSTATTVMCHDQDVDTLTDWIAEELDFDLHHSLS